MTAPQPQVAYLIGSLRNSLVPIVSNQLRGLGFEVFDDWYSAGPQADDRWKDYEQGRQRTYQQAMEGYAAKHVCAFDKAHLDRAHIGVMVMPAGKSGHTELGYLRGQGKRTYILFAEDDPERWDVMYGLHTGLAWNFEQLAKMMGN